MEKNIFENAYFGKPYKTRDGRKAIYLKKGESGKHALIYESEQTYYVNPDGCYYNIECFSHQDYMTSTDIVSEWEEEINEDKLDELAYDYNEERQPNYWWEDDCTVCVCESSEVRKAFEAGYKAAMKGE